ncbi:ribonuclease PH [Paenalkalicoccus suaedae]|uniref:Ribonuclease PH n=1 Tax=Paenalkalicoccus suaedae TaxID=2592382 RepID=A0A859FFT3_9BACI|nr:ribonuclease PH [Paenalkalicoccus suaedae]QKS71967.1 ribonuclease PH [Paenalkalicoccus suaedae]
MRLDERLNNELRKVEIISGFVKHPEGSVLVSFGDTKVICSASVEDRVPPFMRNQGKGWITAEYSMLPRATEQRTIRESSKGKVTGRTMEIQRLIGRALRSVVNLDALGERTIWVDCDVIQADGGTRTASISGAYVAVGLAVQKLLADEKIAESPLLGQLAAVSVGVSAEGEALLDLNYQEDSTASVDMNVVMTSAGELVEVQGTGEEATFTRAQMNDMLDLAEKGIKEIFTIQSDVLNAASEARKEQMSDV